MAESNIQMDHGAKIILAEVSGTIGADDYRSISAQVAKLYNENRYNVIYDLLNSKLDLSFEESIKVPRTIKGKDTEAAHTIKIAALVNKSDYQYWKFIEIMNIGMGFHNKVFTNREEAWQWLLFEDIASQSEGREHDSSNKPLTYSR